MFDMGKRICKLRRDAHLSQKQLGEKIGKSASTIGSYENDTAVPTLENAAALAQEFAAPTSHGAAFSDRKLDILRRLYQEFYR